MIRRRPIEGVACPTCSAAPGDPCQTVQTHRRAPYSHAARVDRFWTLPEHERRNLYAAALSS